MSARVRLYILYGECDRPKGQGEAIAIAKYTPSRLDAVHSDISPPLPNPLLKGEGSG
ncbi:hypothetical protein [Allocoleopsis franciscana]|uniref:hypothetical protein n=1 Tax=Allocoleopsis franciscana TaxID=2886352 RepID=UPI00031EDE3E|nr:hypothetical protein [Allocoleopsis franciscana]